MVDITYDRAQAVVFTGGQGIYDGSPVANDSYDVGLQDNDGRPAPFKALSLLDRLLVVWIVLSMAVGIILGNLVPSVGSTLQRGQFVGVSGPIAAGLLVM